MDLLLETAPERLAALEPELWDRWSQAVVVHPIESGAKRDALAEFSDERPPQIARRWPISCLR